MRTRIAIALAVATFAAAAAPALAASSMSSGSMMAGHGPMTMSPGEIMMMMPNGETMTVPAMKGPMDAGIMSAAKPMAGCMLFMMGKDGKMYMVNDMKMANGKMACSEMSKMK